MLEYPFDAEAIMRSRRSLKKQLQQGGPFFDKKIALLSGSTIGDMKGVLELFLLDFGIQPVFHEGDYGRYSEEILYDDGSLRDFAPDIIYIHNSLHSLGQLPEPGEPKESVQQRLEQTMAQHVAVLEKAVSLGCPVIINNYDKPRLRVMGNYEAVAPSGRVRYVRRLNEMLADWAWSHQSVYINDLDYLSSFYGIDHFSDPSYYNSYKYAVSPQAVPYLCHSVACIIKSIFGKNKKALMLDLDNTLWHGVIGDDGLEGIQLGVESPAGIAHADLQRYAKDLMRIGVVLGVCSKNEEEIARSGFTHPSSILSVDDFAVFRANWQPKHLNLIESADQLNIGADALVFVDDNPAEREIVRQAAAGIAVPELGVAERYAETVSAAGYFEVTSLSADDMKRAEMYRQNSIRQTEQGRYVDYGDYLTSLDMRGTFGAFSGPQLERITQLANKTNQFNLTTRRYQPEEMAARADDPNVITLWGRLADKFGDNGLVSEVIGNQQGDRLDIELWLMSCRVLKRGMEQAMFDQLVKRCLQRCIRVIRGIYLKTEKNAMVAEFYGTLGFIKTEQNGDDSVWEYMIPDNYENQNHYIEVDDEQTGNTGTDR